MEIHSPADIRNLAIVGHASSGKTMLTEALLMCSGAISRMGKITEGSTASDYHDIEKERQISVQATLLQTQWNGKKLNIIDTPGYLDFISEALGALRVADTAVVLVHAQHGVSVGTDRVWKYATEFEIPKVIVINALDKPNVNFDEMLAQARDHYGANVVPFTVPVNAGPGFNKILDAFEKKVCTYDPAASQGKSKDDAPTGEWLAKADELHAALIEKVAESDDALLNKFFDAGSLTEDEFRGGLRNALQKGALIPLFCTAAETNIGVNKLIDFLAAYAPSPADHEAVAALDANDNEIKISLKDAHPTAYIFKTMAEAHFGELSFFRVYSGSLHSGMDLYNADRKISERIGQIYNLRGRERVSVQALCAGDIGALVKLKDTHTGNTLCDSHKPVTLKKLVYPQPTIRAALVINVKGEEDKVAAGLAALHKEDPTFIYKVDSELHQTVISAQGELHLEVLVDRLRRRFNVHVDLAEPKIAFRETIQARAESKHRHKKQTGGAGQFAEVWMRIEPLPRDTGVEFTESLTGQNVDRVFVPSVEEGVKNACNEGIIAGYKVVDVKIDFYDGKMHPVDSKDIAFQIAGYFGFKEAFMQAKPRLLEPIQNVEVHIPEDCLGKVMGDLSSRRGKIQGIDVDGRFQVIRAKVPAKELYHYSSTLRSLTGGRGIHSESFSHYEEMPRELEAKVIEESKKAKAAAQAAAH